MVSYLIQKGHITREEGRKHPRNNEIGKAILASTQNKLVTAEIHSLNRFKAGDLLLICSDGVNESWGDEELITLLCENELSFEDILEEIKSRCSTDSRDNNTAYLLEVEKEDISNKNKKNSLTWFRLI
jgi:serine/threonine protein phosphatase PrpC